MTILSQRLFCLISIRAAAEAVRFQMNPNDTRFCRLCLQPLKHTHVHVHWLLWKRGRRSDESAAVNKVNNKVSVKMFELQRNGGKEGTLRAAGATRRADGCLGTQLDVCSQPQT